MPRKTFRDEVSAVVTSVGLSDEFGQPSSNHRPSAQTLMACVVEVEIRQAEIIRDQLQHDDTTVLSGEAAGCCHSLTGLAITLPDRCFWSPAVLSLPSYADTFCSRS